MLAILLAAHAFQDAGFEVLKLVGKCLALGFQLFRGDADGLDTVPAKMSVTLRVSHAVMLPSVDLHDEESRGR